MKILKRRSSIFVLLLSLVFTNLSYGQITIAGWELNGYTGGGSSPQSPSTSNPNVTIGGLTRGSALSVTSGTPASNAWGTTASVTSITSSSTAITANSFITFTVKPNTAYTMNLDSISAYNIRRSSSGPTSGQWQYSLNGSTFTDIGTTITWGSTTTSAGNLQTAINLSNISALQNITSSTTVTFRCAIWGASGTGGTWYLNQFRTGDDFIVKGTLTSTPTITGAATATAFTTTYGTASAAQSFSVSGAGLTADLIATAPTGFEVSSDGTTYSGTATFTQSSGSASGTLRVRLKANASVGGTYNSQNIVLSSTGATSVNITTASSGNTVSAKALTITGISAANKNYDGNTTVTLNGTAAYSGLVNSESFSVTGTPSASFATASAGTGITVTVSGYTAPSANYSITQPSLSADINPASLTITGLTGTHKEYDATTTANFTGTPAYSGLVNGESFSVTGTASGSFADASIGTAKTITVTGYNAPSANYTVTQPTLTANITARALTVSGLTADNKQYDGTTTATLSGTAVLNGVLAADNGNVTLGGTPSASFASAEVGTNIAVTVTGYTISGSASGNYALTQPSGLTASITSSLLQNQTITFGALSAVTYGDATFNLNATASSGLTVTYSSSNTAVATVSGNTVTIVGAGSANITANQAGDETYNPATPVTRTLTVNPKSLTVSGAVAQNKIYDGTLTAAITGGTLVGVISPDVVSLTGGGSFASSNAGSGIVVTASLSLTGASASNYSITQPTGLSADITAKELTITGLTGNNKNYDGNIIASVSGTPVLSGVITADIGNVVLLEDLAYVLFSSPNAGNNIPIEVYDYILDGPATGNYTLTLPTNITANILPVALTISGITANNKTYDGTTSATFSGTPALIGIISGQESSITLNGTSAVAAFTSAGFGTGKTVQVSGYSLSGSGAGNYTLSQPVILSANIDKANLTVSGLSANNKVYDGNKTATLTGTPALSGLLSGDIGNVTLNGTGTASFADSAAGTAKPVSVTGYSVSGTASGNYNFVQPSGITADITQAAQTITFNSIPVRTIYDTTVTLTINSSAGLPITYSSSNPTVATVTGNVIRIQGIAGTSVITASQPGNNNYSAATELQQTLTVLPALAKWTFDAITTTNTGATPIISAGSGVADLGVQSTGSLFSASHASASTAWTNPAGNGSAKCVASSYWAVGDYYQFKVNSTGYKNLSVYADQTGSNTGPKFFKLQFSLNGTTYTNFGSNYTITNDSWSATIPKALSTKSFDLSSITGINNSATVYFRLVCADTTAISGNAGTGGTNRVDNFFVTGTPCEATSSTQSVVACNSYNWNGTTYTTSGNYTYTTRNATGCDSFAIVNLTINYSTNNSNSVSVCNSYDWNGTTYTSSGTYTYSYNNANGCASVDTLHLTIYTGTFNATTHTACDNYTWNGTTYTTSGTYTYNYNNSNGCASVDTLHLTVIASTSPETSVSACDSYTWSANSTTYTASGSYTAVVGCATQILNLTITASSSNTTTASACDSYTWSVNAQTYTASGTYSVVSGCHTEILNLTITASTTTTVNESSCDGYTWSVNGQTYTATGVYSHVSGCHTDVLNLTFTSSTSSTATITACDSYTWSRNGTTYTTSGSYTHVIGCATYILDLTIVASTNHSENVTNCDSYTWSVNGVTYTTSGNYSSVSGCHTEYLNLTINNSSTSIETISACESYLWHGTTYTASNNTATWTGTNAAGCDSVVTLHLTIKNATSSTETVSACGSYNWHGTTYTASNNTATWTGTNAQGCDSVVTLQLTIKNTSASTETISACGSYSWHGTTYTTSNNTATWTGTNAVGCDSVVTLNLNIKNATTSTTNVTTCGSYFWNGNTYSAGVGANTVLAKWEIPSAITSVTGTSYSYGAANTGVNAAGTNLSSVHTLSATTYSTPSGNGSTYSFSSNNWSTGDYYQTTVATTGYSDITLSWDQTRSGTGPGTFDLKMSVDGGSSFTTVLAGYTVAQAGATGSGTTTWNSGTNQAGFTLNTNLGATAANKSSVILRFVSTVTTAAAGANRIDNINISGKPIIQGSGTYTYTTTNAVGCDSVATLNLTLIDATPTSSTETISACNSYNWHGTTFTSSNNTATWTGTNAAGCDSVVTLNLTIHTGTFASSDVVTCSTYVWHGTSYSASGTYTYVYNNNNGCASTDTLHLTILPSAFITNNTGTTQLSCTQGTISLTAGGGNTYSWSDGTNVIGSNANLNVTHPGTYTVTAYGSNGCVSTATEVITQSIATITSQPSRASRKATIGFVLPALTVSVSGSGNYTYQWYQQTSQSNTGGVAVPGATSSSYVPSSAVASSYYYYLVITSDTGCTTTSEPSGVITICGQ